MMRAVLLAVATALAAMPAVAADTIIVYAHADARAAARVRALAKAFEAVWMDQDLAPGHLWREAIARRVCGAGRVLVVWSGAAAASLEVGAELRHAMACRRVLVPVLLDDTPMPAELGQRQAVDWR